MVTAKFKVTHVTRFEGDSVEVNLQPVMSDDSNKDWSGYTPAGEIKMRITNPAASDQFAPGKKFLLTFEESN